MIYDFRLNEEIDKEKKFEICLKNNPTRKNLFMK